MLDMAKTRRETIRWNLLRALDYARPMGASEHVLVATMQGLYPDSTQQEVRRELDYLADRRLVHVSGQHTGTWLAELARYGVDIAEYTIDCGPGIARPPKYW